MGKFTAVNPGPVRNLTAFLGVYSLASALLAGSARRPLDLAVRFGGEGFVLCWYEADVESALRLVQELRERIAELLLPHEDGTAVTVSIGRITRLSGSGIGWEGLLRSADQAM